LAPLFYLIYLILNTSGNVFATKKPGYKNAQPGYGKPF